jgi:hypothetical protein
MMYNTSKKFRLFITILFFLSPFEINPVKTYSPNSISYQSVDSLIVGVWPTWDRWKSSDRIKELKEKWGFNFIMIYPDTAILKNARDHFSDQNIISLFIHHELFNHNLYEGLFGYYLDEPVTVNHPEADLINAPVWVNKLSGSKFITGDYKRGSELINYVDAYADIVMFTSYKQWNRFLFWWIPGDLDQRSSWDDMKDIFGDKFSLTWVSAQKDIGEFDRLLLHAKKLGLKGIFYMLMKKSLMKKSLWNFVKPRLKRVTCKRN